MRRDTRQRIQGAQDDGEIAGIYAARGEPGVYQSEEKLDAKELGGDPATKERAKLMKECKPEGWAAPSVNPLASGSFG